MIDTIDFTDLTAPEVEDVVLGQVLTDHQAISRAARMLKADHLVGPSHKMVYRTALEMWSEGIGVDLITMTHELRKRGTLELIGGAYTLAKWTQRVVSSTHLDHHCAILVEYYGKRVLRRAGADLAKNTNAASENDALISDITNELSKAAAAELSSDINAGERAYTMLDEVKPKPYYFNMVGVDDYVFLLPGNMVTVSAPSGVGKTAFALSAVLNLIHVLKPWIVSLEMPADELLIRALCQLACVDISDALQDRLSPQDRERMAAAAIAHGEALSRMSIEDSGSMSIDRFRALAEHKVKNDGVRLIVVDYAQLMDADPVAHKGLADQNEAISKGLRSVARSLNIILLVVVHVNRQGEAHGSVQYEKDAHVRLKLSREKGDAMMTVDIIKNRNGRTGSVPTPFEGRFGLVGRTAHASSQFPAKPKTDHDTPF